MVKTEALYPELAEIVWRRFNFPWCTEYSLKLYQGGLDLLIHKDTTECRPHRLRTILIFDIEPNIHNKHLGRTATRRPKNINGLAPEQYGSRKAKAEDIQALITRLFYDLIRKQRIPDTSIFADLLSNYDLGVHSINSLSLQIFWVPKGPIICNLTNLQNMNH